MDRTEWLSIAGAKAVEFEQQALSVGDEFLPPFARDVRDGGEATADYWDWLAQQFQQS